MENAEDIGIGNGPNECTIPRIYLKLSSADTFSKVCENIQHLAIKLDLNHFDPTGLDNNAKAFSFIVAYKSEKAQNATIGKLISVLEETKLRDAAAKLQELLPSSGQSSSNHAIQQESNKPSVLLNSPENSRIVNFPTDGGYVTLTADSDNVRSSFSGAPHFSSELGKYKSIRRKSPNREHNSDLSELNAVLNRAITDLGKAESNGICLLEGKFTSTSNQLNDEFERLCDSLNSIFTKYKTRNLEISAKAEFAVTEAFSHAYSNFDAAVIDGENRIRLAQENLETHVKNALSAPRITYEATKIREHNVFKKECRNVRMQLNLPGCGIHSVSSLPKTIMQEIDKTCNDEIQKMKILFQNCQGEYRVDTDRVVESLKQEIRSTIKILQNSKSLEDANFKNGFHECRDNVVEVISKYQIQNAPTLAILDCHTKLERHIKISANRINCCGCRIEHNKQQLFDHLMKQLVNEIKEEENYLNNDDKKKVFELNEVISNKTASFNSHVSNTQQNLNQTLQESEGDVKNTLESLDIKFNDLGVNRSLTKCAEWAGQISVMFAVWCIGKAMVRHLK